MFQPPTKHPWMTDAACAAPGVDPDLWFPNLQPYRGEEGVAIAICQACPVKPECLAHALAEPNLGFGIWAGLTSDEIRSMRRQQRRNP
jgi:WhiB family redox-sensing transcriptional regulator